MLQDGRVDPSVDDNSAIRSASMNRYTDTVELLLQDDRVDPSAADDEANWQNLVLQDDRMDPNCN